MTAFEIIICAAGGSALGSFMALAAVCRLIHFTTTTSTVVTKVYAKEGEEE